MFTLSFFLSLSIFLSLAGWIAIDRQRFMLFIQCAQFVANNNDKYANKRIDFLGTQSHTEKFTFDIKSYWSVIWKSLIDLPNISIEKYGAAGIRMTFKSHKFVTIRVLRCQKKAHSAMGHWALIRIRHT